jgi:26S proteasome regulatory subunit N9
LHCIHEDPEKHVSFLTSLDSRIPADSAPDAHVLLLASRARAKLVYGDAEGTRSDLEATRKILDESLAGAPSGVNAQVNAAYWGVSADYHKAKADYAPYYRNSLLYLACIDLTKDLTQEERVARAHDLALAALLGDSIYNFGELLMHPILDELDGNEHEWLKKLLFTFNEGSIGKFEALAPQFGREVSRLRLSPAYDDSTDNSGTNLHVIADIATELPVPAAEDLSDGAHRVCVPSGCV